jgi:hypothetical protein
LFSSIIINERIATRIDFYSLLLLVLLDNELSAVARKKPNGKTAEEFSISTPPKRVDDHLLASIDRL